MSRKRTARQQTMGGGKVGEASAGRARAKRAGMPVRASSAGASCRSPGQCGGAKWILLAIGALLVLGSVRALAGGAGPDAGLPREGSPAPSLKAKTLDGDRLSLADLRGKVVLVNFWATWCPPCVAEMPSLERLHRTLSPEGLAVVTVSTDEDQAELRKFVAQHGLTLPVLMDPGGRVAGGDSRTTPYPETFLLDRQGRILRHVVGPAEWDSPEMLADLRRQLGGAGPGSS